MTHSPLEIAVASLYFSLKYHNLSHLMPGGMQWYSQWTVSEERIYGKQHTHSQTARHLSMDILPNAIEANGIRSDTLLMLCAHS